PAHLAAARWFGGKGREFTVTGVTRLGEIPGGPPEPRVVVDLVEVRYDDGAEPAHELYQLPLALYEHPQERLSHAFISWHDEGPGTDGTDGTDGTEHWVHAYDAVHDREAMAVRLAAFAAAEPDDGDSAGEDRGGAAGDPLLFHRLAGLELAVDATSTPVPGEPSHSPGMFGADAPMKVFRKVTPGGHPHVE